MAEGGSLPDDELYLPRTVINKLIKEMVPNIRVSTDSRDLLLNCCSEFIHLLASEANEISERQQKKVISPEHVIEALTTLGFQEYVADVKTVHKEYKEQASKHRKRGKSRLDRLGIPEEELARQQQQLFDEARQQHLENELLEQQRLQQQQQLMGTVPTQPSQLPPSTAPQPSQLPPSTAPQPAIRATQQPPMVVAPKPAKDLPEQTSVGTSQKDLVRAALQQHVQAMAVNPSASQHPAVPDKKEQVPLQAKAAPTTQPVPIAPLPSLPMASLINSSPSLLQQAMTAQASASTQQTAANMAQFMLLAQQAMKTSQLMQAMQQQSVSRPSGGLKPPPAAPTATQDSSGGDTKQ